MGAAGRGDDYPPSDNTMTAKKKKTVKKTNRKSAPRAVKHELVVRVAPQAPTTIIPTTQDLAEPIRDGKKLTIPKTWLTEKQITRLVEKTPPQYVYKRPGKGGGTWDYVTVSYVQRLLDFSFGFNWDFDIVEHGKEADHVWVLGRLTVRDPENKYSIVKTQFGRSEVKHKSGGKEILDYGNDLKAAASDALKKCASMLGIARDIYGKGDYKAESGKEAREVTPNPVTHPSDGPAIQTLPASTKDVICRGPKGKGCSYGNDVDPLSSEVVNYSTKMYGLALCKDCQKDAPRKK